MGKYNKGDRVAWKSLNRDYTGCVVGFYQDFAVVLLDGDGRHILLQNEPIKKK